MVLMVVALSFVGFIGWGVFYAGVAFFGDTGPDHYAVWNRIGYAGSYAFGAGLIGALLWAVAGNLKRRRDRMPLSAFLPGLLTCCPLLVLTCCLMARSLADPPVLQRYPSFGRDTVDSFGDGRFQVHRSPAGNRLLWDEEQDIALLAVTFDWREEGEHIYAYGKDGETVRHQDGHRGPSMRRVYLVVNWRTGHWTKYRRMEDVPAPHREQARQLRIK
jgi:hypothetical protein